MIMAEHSASGTTRSLNWSFQQYSNEHTDKVSRYFFPAVLLNARVIDNEALGLREVWESGRRRR